MSVIFPGNYVADLNAYRDQGVFSLPGVEFYQMRGIAIVDSNLVGTKASWVKCELRARKYEDIYSLIINTHQGSGQACATDCSIVCRHDVISTSLALSSASN